MTKGFVKKVLLFTIVVLSVCLLPVKITKVSAADKYDKNLKKVMTYVNKKGGSVKVSKDITLSVLDSGKGIRVSRELSQGENVLDHVSASFYYGSSTHEVSFGRERHEWGDDGHLIIYSGESMTLYTAKSGKLYKYQSQENTDFGSSNSIDSETEEIWTKMVSSVTKYLKKKAKISFKPIKAFSKYTAIDHEYYEPKIFTKKCKDTKEITLNPNEVDTDPHDGDKVTFVIKSDLNGDGKKESIKLIFTYTDYYWINSAKINSIKVREFDSYESFRSVQIIDKDPSDKYKELLLKMEDPMGYFQEAYRYNGKKVTCVEEPGMRGGGAPEEAPAEEP